MSSRSRRASSSTHGLVAVCERLADRDRVVIVDGLNRDFLGRPFGPMPELLAIAEEVVMLSAICMVCGGEATRTQRLVDGRPATPDDPARGHRRDGRRALRGTLPDAPRGRLRHERATEC